MRSVRESFRIRLLKKQQQESKIFNNICQGGVFGDSDPGLVRLFLFFNIIKNKKIEQQLTVL